MRLRCTIGIEDAWENKFLSRGPDFWARRVTCAPDRARQKNGRPKSKCKFYRDRTRNVAFCY